MSIIQNILVVWAFASVFLITCLGSYKVPTAFDILLINKLAGFDNLSRLVRKFPSVIIDFSS